MRLKCIKLAGFKSFVDPTTVRFPSNMVAIVGPNGCGKSNIIDAVRWVMGESSAKNLRGENMTDVIFNGSSSRKPVGQASIELVFDNSDGSLGGEYAGYAEIALRRKVTREGISQYYLNGTKCRRRDITDIFLGTGLGPRSYAIIEQGMISRLIESKPEDLRIFIEEAAGISKYKERRRDTENRINRTRENLERLTDLREELERQLQHLKRQANAAERYGELKKEERLLKSQLSALQWRKLDVQTSEQNTWIRDLEVKLEAAVAVQRSLDAAIERYRHQHMELGDHLNEVQARYYGVGSEIARAEQAIQHNQERSKQLSSDLRTTLASHQEAERHIRTDEEKLTAWRQELEQLEPQLGELSERESGSRVALQLAEQAMHEWQRRWDGFNHEASEPKKQAEVQQSRIQHIEQGQLRLQQRIDRLGQEDSTLQPAAEQQEIATLQQRLASLMEKIATHQSEYDKLTGKVEQNRQHLQEVSQQLDGDRNALQKMRGRQASLEALQQAALSETSEVVSAWLEQQGLADRPRLAHNLQVDAGWETAVETVLGKNLQAVCVDGLERISTALEQLHQGSLTVVDTSVHNIATVSGDAGVMLTEKVRGEAGALALIAGIYIAEDLPAAMQMRERLQAHESVVTRDGLWLGRSWLCVAKETDAISGVIKRTKELEELEPAIQALEVAERDRVAAQEQARVELRNCEIQRDSLQQELKALSADHGELRVQLSTRQAKLEQTQARQERSRIEVSECREQLVQEQENLRAARELLQDAVEKMRIDELTREELIELRDEAREGLELARKQAHADKDAGHQVAIRVQSLRAQVESIQQNIQRTRAQFSQLDERRRTLQEALQDGEQPMEAIRQELEGLLSRRLEIEAQLTAVRQQVQGVEHDLREAEKSRHEAEQNVGVVRTGLEDGRLQARTLLVQRNIIEQQLSDMQADPTELLAQLPDGAEENAWEQQLETLNNRIQRLGPINLAAIDEYQSQSERKLYLDSQNEDLVNALETLENAIRKIDRETRMRFKETFDQVNSGLQDLFPRVFGGGNAYLEMTGEDLLDTGVAVMARPPGKRNSTIHLLSGGEKALTAIALVFSIFRLNPAPFCMLDEVDAPLDDANIGRYARMIQEMSEHVQFIYITHNKTTIESAQQLMGVTMHEPGCSRLVSVDIDKAAEFAAAS